MNAKILGVAVVVIALAGGGWWWYSSRAKHPRDTWRAVTATIAPIEETIDATGSVLPLNRVEIKPPISGRIDKLLVDEGAKVTPGQIIAWMSSTDRAAILDAARAQGPAELARWEDTYKASPIVAPLPGVIILRNVVEGQTVDPTVVLYAMSDKLIVIAKVDESDIGRVKIGIPARVILDSYPDKPVEGKVFDILYEGTNTSNVIQYGVKIRIDKVPDFFRSQMTANVSFIVQRKTNALLLPASALRDNGSGTKTVFVPDPDGGNPIVHEVKTGIENDQSVEIISGLSEGDKVMVRQTKYVAQQALQSSPLTLGARPGGPTGQAPRSKR